MLFLPRLAVYAVVLRSNAMRERVNPAAPIVPPEGRYK